MRNPQKKVVVPLTSQSTSNERKKRITCELDEYLLVKLRNIIQAEQASGFIKYNSVNELIRQALLSYQQGMTLTKPRQLGNPRVPYSISLSPDLVAIYQSWPTRQKTAKLETVLLSYLNTI